MIVQLRASNGVYYTVPDMGLRFDHRPEALAYAHSLGESVSAAFESNLSLELFHRVQQDIQAQTFVETGTAWGDTTEMIAPEVDLVWTIEASRPQYERARERLSVYSHVHCLFGDSRQHLAALAPKLTQPAIFWLDAHYSGGGTAGVDEPCPLLSELTSLGELRGPHAIIIDDARLLGTERGWPTLNALVSALPWPAAVEQVGDQVVIYR